MKILKTLQAGLDDLDRYNESIILDLGAEVGELRTQSEAVDVCCNGALQNIRSFGANLRAALDEAARRIEEAVNTYEDSLNDEIDRFRQTLTHALGVRAGALQSIQLRVEAGAMPPASPTPEDEADIASAREMAAKLAPAERDAA